MSKRQPPIEPKLRQWNPTGSPELPNHRALTLRQLKARLAKFKGEDQARLRQLKLCTDVSVVLLPDNAPKFDPAKHAGVPLPSVCHITDVFVVGDMIVLVRVV